MKDDQCCSFDDATCMTTKMIQLFYANNVFHKDVSDCLQSQNVEDIGIILYSRIYEQIDHPGWIFRTCRYLCFNRVSGLILKNYFYEKSVKSLSKEEVLRILRIIRK